MAYAAARPFLLVSGQFVGITTTGSKLWRFSYRFDAKQKLLALGQYPVTSLADARIKRDNAKKLLAEGIDPSVDSQGLIRKRSRLRQQRCLEVASRPAMLA